MQLAGLPSQGWRWAVGASPGYPDFYGRLGGAKPPGTICNSAHRRLAPPGVAAGPELLSPLQPAGARAPPSRHLPSNAACLTCFAVARENKVLLFHFAGRKRSR